MSPRFEFHPREEVCFRKVAFRTQKTMDRDVIRTQKHISRRKGRTRRSYFLVDFIHLSIAAGRISGKELINIKVRKVGLQNFHQTLRS